MRDVVEDLIAKPLADDLGRYLAGAKTRHPRGATVVARDLVYFGVDNGARDFDDEIFLRVADVDKLCFHL